MKMKSLFLKMLLAGMFLGISHPVIASDNNDALDSRMDEVLAQSAEEAADADRRAADPEAEESGPGQTGPVTDPLDPQPMRMRAMQVGGGDQEVGAGTAFNPAISVILDGGYRNVFSGDEEDPGGFDAGHSHDHGHGGHDHGFAEGFSLREVELVLAGTVDPYFDMMIQLAAFDDGIEIEEAFVTTRAMPAGWQAKIGRFLSDVGYINKQHLHDWHFADQPWVIEQMFGEEGLRETGVQLTWMPPTETYTRFGVELLQGTGDSPGIAAYEGDGNHDVVTVLPDDDGAPERNRWRDRKGFRDTSAPNLATFFAKWAPDLGYDHALQLGVSAGVSDVLQREEAHSSGRLETWDGDASFWGLDAVYKYDGQGIHGHRNFQLQGEYFRRTQDLTYMSRQFTDFDTLEPTGPDDNPDVRDQSWSQDGLYLQGIYGIAPRWNIGARVDALGLTNDAYADQADGRGLPTEFDTSYRYALQASYLPTEFSRLRAQVNYNEIGGERGQPSPDNHWEFILQFNMAIGVHGAHEF